MADIAQLTMLPQIWPYRQGHDKVLQQVALKAIAVNCKYCKDVFAIFANIVWQQLQQRYGWNSRSKYCGHMDRLPKQIPDLKLDLSATGHLGHPIISDHPTAQFPKGGF